MASFRKLRVLAAAALYWSLPLHAEAAGCFSVLSDPTVRKAADFADLAKTTTRKKVDGVKDFLHVEDTDTVNVDFYYVRFKNPPGKTLKAVFKEMRQKFGLFAEGFKKDFGFDAYGANRGDPNDKLYVKNAGLWKQDLPLDALMSFNLDTLWPETFRSRRGGKVYNAATADGDLQVTCASDTDFVFSTVESERGGPHPVSGNRGFGLMDNGDGTWTFYSKAVDRKSAGAKNWMAGALAKIGAVDNVYCLGHGFWMQFYPLMQKYLRENGMSTSPNDFYHDNHGPVPFPLQDPLPKTTECG